MGGREAKDRRRERTESNKDIEQLLFVHCIRQARHKDRVLLGRGFIDGWGVVHDVVCSSGGERMGMGLKGRDGG